MASEKNGFLWFRVYLFKLIFIGSFLAPIWVPAVVTAIVGVPPEDSEVPKKVTADFLGTGKEPWQKPASIASDGPRYGDVQLLPWQIRVSTWEQRKELKPFEPASRMLGFSSKKTGEIIFIAAPSVTGSLHVPNAYLVGHVPFTVREPWMPLYAVADHLHYQHDHAQFKGRQEVWLTTTQSWIRARGDCEDHAILVADWLIEMGLDARVVLGKHGSEGHAWVVVFAEGKEYLIEATLKRKLGRWSAYPLANMLPMYHPEMMFNRETLWLNTGTNNTVSYTGNNWKPLLLFKPIKSVSEQEVARVY